MSPLQVIVGVICLPARESQLLGVFLALGWSLPNARLLQPCEISQNQVLVSATLGQVVKDSAHSPRVDQHLCVVGGPGS